MKFCVSNMLVINSSYKDVDFSEALNKEFDALVETYTSALICWFGCRFLYLN